MAPRIPRCPTCGSSRLSFDATAEWDVADQCFVLVTEYDEATCEECGETTSVPEWEDV